MSEVEEKKVVVEENKKTEDEKSTTKSTEEESGLSEEPQTYFEPVVKLEAVEVVSGEEEEEVLFKMRAKLFCYRETLLDKGTGKKSWCERGVGEVRFLKHREFGKVRLLMRQEKTHKIIANHLVESRTELSPNMGSDRAWVWSCYDFADGEVEAQVFAIRFGNAENATKFKEAYEDAKKNNKALEDGADAEETSKGDEAADALEKLNVIDSADTLESHESNSGNDASEVLKSFNDRNDIPISSNGSKDMNRSKTRVGIKLYRIKRIKIGQTRNVGIITQNENGPCPLISITNTLILTKRIELENGRDIISSMDLIRYIGAYMVELKPSNLSLSELADYEHNLKDALELLPKLETGLDVNIRFSGPRDFEFTKDLLLFDLLCVNLYHGWVINPSEVVAAQAIGSLSYNQILELIINEENNEATEQPSPNQALLKQFLDDNATQLTNAGICKLNEVLRVGECGVLFRNNHFSTLIKVNGNF